MIDGNVTPEMLDRVQEQRAAAVMRQQEQEAAREEWPLNVNAALNVLAGKIADQEARIAKLEAGAG